MEIIVGKKAGFCYGVKEAVTKAENVAIQSKSEKVYCLGELVHNKQVVNKLKEQGIVFINHVEDLKEGEKAKLIIRAHGIPKETYMKVKEKNIELYDFTCPNVLAIHKVVENYSKNGYFTLLIGEEKHPETIGTISFANGNGIVLEKQEQIDEVLKILNEKNVEKLLIVAQTTFSLEKFENYVKQIKENLSLEIVVKNTICNATRLRQEEAETLSADVDYMIVIGGKNSANSMKLYEISKKNCKNTAFIETYKELEGKLEEIKACEKIGIMAGASTPDTSINEVVDFLS